MTNLARLIVFILIPLSVAFSDSKFEVFTAVLTDKQKRSCYDQAEQVAMLECIRGGHLNNCKVRSSVTLSDNGKNRNIDCRVVVMAPKETKRDDYQVYVSDAGGKGFFSGKQCRQAKSLAISDCLNDGHVNCKKIAVISARMIDRGSYYTNCRAIYVAFLNEDNYTAPE